MIEIYEIFLLSPITLKVIVLAPIAIAIGIKLGVFK